MSSPTKPYPCEGVVRRGGEATGPIRLPMDDRRSFVDAFNRRYQAIGMAIVPLVDLGEDDVAQIRTARPPGAGDDAADRDR
jgi:hypothetical protein